MLKIKDPKEVLLAQLGQLLYVEEELANKVLPELIEQAEDGELKQGLTLHATQTHDHVVNLRRVFELLGEEPKTKSDPALKALQREHKLLVKRLDSPKLKDLAHAEAVVKTEHLEIAAYTGLLALANPMHLAEEIPELLEKNLEQEQKALELGEQAGKQLGEQAAAVAATPS